MMKHYTIALFVFVFALGSPKGGLADDSDANLPVIVNNKSSSVPPITVIPDVTTEKPVPSTTAPPSSKKPLPPDSTTVATSTTPSSTSATTTTSTIKPSSTVTPTNSTTVQPQTTTASLPTTAAPHKGNRFDGPSFIGGIILATGLMGIGFVAFKFYKARTERNYHTL